MFVLSALILVGMIVVGDTHGLVSSQVPAIGRFLAPATGVWQQAEATEQKDQVNTIPGAVEGSVVFDTHGIPHVFAESRADAAYLQGYCHARDRLFQMDISTRATSGRLAEVLGVGLLERDRQQRRKGLLEAAKRTVEKWLENEEIREILLAYTQGVNTYLAALRLADYPLEYKLLGFTPEQWTPLKSALFSLSMAESLCFRNRDVATTNARALLGDSLFLHLYPEINPKDSPIIPVNTTWGFEPITLPKREPDAEVLSQLDYPELPMSPEGIGSNNWAVAGAKTASGSPILANDPHLGLTLPSIWYQIHIKTNDLNTQGVSLPGLPGIVIGFNEKTAWGITNVGHDVLDWYRIQWTDTQQTAYVVDGKTLTPEWKEDTIWVRDQSTPEIVRTPWTIFGPVVYDQPDNSYYNLAMRWVPHDAPHLAHTNQLKVFWDLMGNKGLDNYQDALEGFAYPASNIVYASQAGDVALTVTGRFPLRQPGQGRTVQEGISETALWPGFIPFEQIPRTVNPERQFVASANQRSTATDYPYYYYGSFEDYRGRYINRSLDSMRQVVPEDMMALQYDSYNILAEDVLPLMLDLVATADLSTGQTTLLDRLKNWDKRHVADKQEPVIFQNWLDSLYRFTFDEVYALEQGDAPLLFPENWHLVRLLEEMPQDAIFDDQTTTEVETAQEMVTQAFVASTSALDSLLQTGYDWNARRNSRIPHLARVPGLGRDRLVTDGSRSTPNSLSATFGPSWRMVVSLENPVKAWGVLPGGTSGNPGSPLYEYGIEEWSKGEYFELFLYEQPEEVLEVRERLVFEK